MFADLTKEFLENSLRAHLSTTRVYQEWDKVKAHFIPTPYDSWHVDYNYETSHVVRDSIPAWFSLTMDEGRVYVAMFEVHETLRRQGIGKELYYAMEAFCLDMEIKIIDLFPDRPGKHFWPAVGFKPAEFFHLSKELVRVDAGKQNDKKIMESITRTSTAEVPVIIKDLEEARVQV